MLCEVGAGAAADARGVAEVLRGVGVEGRDPEYIRRTLPALDALVRAYFRPDVRGLDNIPAEGPVLLVGNHSGGLYIADTIVLACAFYRHFGADRRFHQLAHDVAARVPYLGGMRRYGTVPASYENAEAAFALGAAVLVYPGGDYETFRPSWESADIEFDHREGFLRLALGAGVPLVPVVSVGGQETALFLTRGEWLARIKVLPLSFGPPFGLNVLDLPGRLPLPAKITISVLPPIDLTAALGADPDLDAAYDLVTGVMQEELSTLQEERGLPIVG
jgi:1-acyl-sn-glycerol-3-phosphate acyltransferase